MLRFHRDVPFFQSRKRELITQNYNTLDTEHRVSFSSHFKFAVFFLERIAFKSSNLFICWNVLGSGFPKIVFLSREKGKHKLTRNK